MEVPERLALIGGGILLSSTLIFTLKGQASQLIPRVSQSIGSIYNHVDDTQKDIFNSHFQQAQQNGWTTGTWGTAKYYIHDNALYVGPGKLIGNLHNTIGDQSVHTISSIDFEGKVQAPPDSSWLLAASRGFGDNNHNLQTINGTQNIDTSQVRYMGDMFENDMSIQSLDLSNWDTSHVVDMNSIFDADQSLQSLNVSDWNVTKVQNLSWAFYLTSLQHLDLSGWHTSDINDTEEMFDNDKSLQGLDLRNFDTSHLRNMIGMYNNTDRLSRITLNDNTHFDDDVHIQGNDWQNGNVRLSNHQLTDNDMHPGTWVRQ